MSIEDKKDEQELEKFSNQSDEYGASKIKILEGLEAVRKRPGMYIGTQDETGLHKMLYEVLDNSVDEHMAGHAKHVHVRLLADDVAEIEDDGRGIPVALHPRAKVSSLEVVMTKLHAGGKFEKDVYKVSGGLHGVGVSVVNALSEHLEVEVYRNGTIHFQAYSHGKPKEDVRVIGKTKKRGTLVRFRADNGIFPSISFDRKTVENKMDEITYLNDGLSITLIDERGKKSFQKVFLHTGGIREMVEQLVGNRKRVHKKIIFLKGKTEEVEGDFALLYHERGGEHSLCFTNGIANPLGGTHIEGFRGALTRTLNEFLSRETKLQKKTGEAKLAGEDTREGLICVIKIRISEPQFNSQTKEKLVNREVKGIVQQLVSERLSFYFEENASEVKQILQKCVLSFEAREAAKEARELITKRKGFLEGGGLPGKLTDCIESNPSKSELFIVEGDSAGGSAKQGRDRNFQAVFPLRGKLANILKNPKRIYQNEQIRTLIASLGLDPQLDENNLDKLRYHKIIIMTDADVDGSHIRTLLLTLFFTKLETLINQGYLYIAQPPLFLVKQGKNKNYAYTIEEKDAILQKIDPEERKKIIVQRYKGLGEMNADQLWETTMDPYHRTILQLEPIPAATHSNVSNIFNTLMGEDVEPRRNFIEKNAKFVSHLDF